MTQKQHVDMHRKLMLRKNLLHTKQGVFYIPFIGEGDIAVELYSDAEIYGADIEPDCVETASGRLKGSIITADCNGWPFPGVENSFDVADFDSYSEPYQSFRCFWDKANKADKMTLFFTDGQKQSIFRTATWINPDGVKVKFDSITEQRKVGNFYFPKYILPWFLEYIKPYRVKRKLFYLRGFMLYWGAVIEK